MKTRRNNGCTFLSRSFSSSFHFYACVQRLVLEHTAMHITTLTWRGLTAECTTRRRQQGKWRGTSNSTPLGVRAVLIRVYASALGAVGLEQVYFWRRRRGAECRHATTRSRRTPVAHLTH